MANMSYCRMENTAKDLRDVAENMGDVSTVSEAKAQVRIYEICQRIVDEHDIDTLKEQLAELIAEDVED